MENLAQGILSILGTANSVFLRLDPEIVDITKNEAFQLKIFGKAGIVEVRVDQNNIIAVLGILKETVFSENFHCVFWNSKNFFSAVLRYTKKFYKVSCKLVDLKIIEAYSGIRQDAPNSYVEAISRVRSVFKDSDRWKKIYGAIHLPLITHIVPSLENVGIIDSERRKLLKPYYEIEGTKNGRFKCSVAFEEGFNPHTLGPEQRKVLLPYGEDAKFVSFDFKFMEVTVLQWLSDDENLKKILDSGEDFYRAIFKLLTGKDCDTEKYRNFAKSVFLPVVFGLTAKGMAEDRKISLKFAEHIIDTLNNSFPAAMAFVQRQQYETEVSDYLGRIRKFEPNSCTKVKNFVIQSPASTICLEKLINLIKKIGVPIGYFVHDGYMLYVKTNKIDYVKKAAKEILEQPSELMPGLKLKTKCKVGPTLDSLIDSEERNGKAKEEESVRGDG